MARFAVITFLLWATLAFASDDPLLAQESTEASSANGTQKLNQRLIDYLDDRAWKELQVNYRAQLKWFEEAHDDRTMAIYVIMRQVEISMRNRAIKVYLVHVLRRLVREQFDLKRRSQADAGLLEAMRDFLIARAQLRAKLMMIRANELHWIALKHDFESFSVYYSDEEVKRLATLTPRERLDPTEELPVQTAAFERVRDMELVQATMKEQWRVLDRLLDEYTGCRSCHELIENRWSEAARLQRNVMVSEWVREHVEPDFRHLFEQDRQNFIERKRLRVLSLSELKEKFDQEAMEQWRNETLG